MFYRTGNLRRATALAGVMLSLSVIAQNCGLYCQLGACGTVASASVPEKGSCCQHCGGHTDPDLAHSHSNKPCQQHHDSDDESCPCPESCWCHQAPQPSELPRPSGGDVELTYQGIFTTSAELVATIASPTEWTSESRFADSSDHSLCSCAMLCRFLI